MDSRPIGEILLANGLVTEQDVDGALNFQREVGGLFGQALLRLGALSEDQLLQHLSAQLELDILEPVECPNDPGVYRKTAQQLDISVDWLAQHDAVIWFPETGEGRAEPASADTDSQSAEHDPFQAEAYTPEMPAAELTVFARSPLDSALCEGLERAHRGVIRYVLGPNRLLDASLASMRSSGVVSDADDLSDAARLREMAEEAPVIDLVNGMFEDALRQRASDIHIEPFEDHVQIRFRIDGVLRTMNTLPRGRFDAIASRVKLLSGMDIAERRLPQDGRQSVRFAGQDIDLRVSSLPGAWGESIVLRLLRKQQSLPTLEGLGVEGHAMDSFRRLLEERNGVILVTGPTGSGKSTTLYRGLELANDGQRKIITIEDPVEYDMDGVTQVQARADIGYTFARGLRAILRQDPDVIMIGEIRDGETASIGIQAALTGHLVFSTLHTNSALAAIERLVDLGVEPFLVSASLRGLMGQRLVRRLCSHCSRPASGVAVEQARERLAEIRNAGAVLPEDVFAQPSWMEAVGCPRCANSGYSGRVAVFEVARFTPALREAINDGRPEAELLAAIRPDGFLTMYEDGLIKAAKGYTTVEEVIRVLGAGGAAASARAVAG